MRRRSKTLWILAAFAAGCSSAHPKERGLESSVAQLNSSEFPCNHSVAMQSYVRELWASIQAAWVVPFDTPVDQLVRVELEFDGRGETRDPKIAEASDPILLKSVEQAVREADQPSPSDDVRACLAGQVIKLTFRNQAK